MLDDTNGVKVFETAFGKVKVFLDMPVVVHELSESGMALNVNQIVFHANYTETDFSEGYACGLVRLSTVQNGIEKAKRIDQVIIPESVKLFNAGSGSECNYRD